MRRDEFAFIDELLRPLARGAAGALGLDDDAALLDPPADRQLVVAKDALVLGVHAREDDPPETIGRKLLRRNLSDLAAMGAEPLAYLTALCLPRTLEDAWIEAFIAGLAEDQQDFGLHLLGGDTVATSGPFSASLTILGTVPPGAALRRRGAQPGDDLWVSGTLGEAALGLRILAGLAVPDEDAGPFIQRYRLPQPRLQLGVALRGLAHAVIDVSDGLVQDLERLCRASGVGARIELARLPVRDVTRQIPGWREAVLAGGDDYELLFAAPKAARGRLSEIAAGLTLPLARIGTVQEQREVVVLDEEGRPLALARTGWRHF